MIRAVTAFIFGQKTENKTSPSPHREKARSWRQQEEATREAPPDVVQTFLRRHKAALKSLLLETGPRGFTFREEKLFEDRGLRIELHAEARSNYRPSELSKLTSKEEARHWLTQLQAELFRKNQQVLARTEDAIKALLDLTLRENELRWLGDEAGVRQKYLNFPPKLAASEARGLARRLHQEIQTATTRAKLLALNKRLAHLSPARLSARVLRRHYQESLPFLSKSLDLELKIEKTLDFYELDQLLAVSDEGFAASVEAILSNPRQALIAKVENQLHDLERRIKTLPHVELLTDTDIAAIVAPYYGGLSRAIKKRHAKSALVAVEEQAREAKYQDDVGKLNEHRDAYADVASYYPLARSLKRQLVLYVGPTNSGKTWRSLNELAEGGSGVYLAPLRLLALEGQEELEKRGKITSFLTGEERDLKPDAFYVSSTIEMLNFETQVDAVVIDEVQMLADERRGWAWLAALVGAPAKKVIMTGSPDCIEIVQDLAAYLGEDLLIHECQRYNELRVAPAPIRLRDVRPGMAVVCFSRRDVLRIKATIEANSDFTVAVVYGNLSPQIRREEARRFRTGEADILVATDAIAMGLNLPISEVLFFATEKFNGEEMCELTPSEIRQIGGRAGRYGVANFGVVNALDAESLRLITDALQGSTASLSPPYYVAPGPNHVRIISQVLGTNSLERILTFFSRAIEFSDDRFARSNIDDLSYLAPFVDERLPFIDVTERLTIASAPVGIRNETVVQWFLDRMLPAFKDPNYPDEAEDPLDDLFEAANRFERGIARSQLQLRDAEDYLKTLTIYAWLAFRYPQVFTRIEDCEQRREAVNAFVERSLKGSDGKHCISCEAKLPETSRSRRCPDCRSKERLKHARRGTYEKRGRNRDSSRRRAGRR